MESSPKPSDVTLWKKLGVNSLRKIAHGNFKHIEFLDYKYITKAQRMFIMLIKDQNKGNQSAIVGMTKFYDIMTSQKNATTRNIVIGNQGNFNEC